MDLDVALATLRTLPAGLVLAALFCGALVEYLVPPFPGDTVVVAGAALVAAAGWPALPVVLATTAGAVLGAWIDLWIGRWWVDSGRLDRLSPRSRRVVDGWVDRFRRGGAGWLLVNRFVPGVRPLFFVAAGVAGVRTAPALAAAGISAAAWNGLLVGAGLAAGRNVERLGEWVSRYNAGVGVLIAVLLVAIAWRARASWRAEP